jgi:predicted ribosome quality control (RQC) complex YloA/Tae2 family protein
MMSLFELQMILFQFGLGSNAHFIILELYAQGNIILTDSEYTVMTLLRSHRFVWHYFNLLYVLGAITLVQK